MIKELKIWDKGKMTLNVDGKLKKVHVSQENLNKTYEKLKNRLKKGKVTLGIDHFPEEILNQAPILKKMDILNVGEFDDAELKEDGIYALNVNLTNDNIKALYEKNEIEDISIVSNSKLKECPNEDYDYDVLETDIYRVDIVEKGACTSCKLPKFNGKVKEAVISASFVQNFTKEISPMSLKDKIKETNVNTPNGDGENVDQNKNGTSLVEELIKSNNNLASIVKQLYDVVMKYETTDEDVNQTQNNQQSTGLLAASQNATLLKEVQELKTMLTEDRKVAEEQKVDAYLEACLQAGKFLPAQKETMKKLAIADFKSFDEMMSKQEAVIDLTGKNKHSLSASANLNLNGTSNDKVFDDIDFFNKLTNNGD